jgi:transcriptional regulator with XRE-family HTH domain
MIDKVRDLKRPLPLLLPADVTDMRRLCALSMRQLARRLDVNVDTVSEWERGSKVPTRAHTYKLLDCFMVEMRTAGTIHSKARRLRQRATEAGELAAEGGQP